MRTSESLRINSDRLSRRLKEMGEIGALPDGGVCRTALSDADRDGRNLLKKWMLQIDLEFDIDKIGNMFGTYGGNDKLPAIMFGSHLDTVTTGGLYDGSLGVLAGLEVLETLHEAGIRTSRPLILTNFTNEEGVRFVPDMMGSLAFSLRAEAGDLYLSTALDGSGSTVKDELKRIGYLGSLECGRQEIRAFLELHIEQGPILESEAKDIGIVEKVQGISWTEYIFEGLASHAGTTPMNRRKDAGFAAFSVASHLRELTSQVNNGQVGTVGNIELFPNLINVCAEKAKIITDLRNPDNNILSLTQERLDKFVNKIVKQEGLQLKRKELVRLEPIKFDPEIVSSVSQAAQELGYSSRLMISGAGHDAQLLATKYPAAMIFIASKDGLSHNINEYSSQEDIEKGCNTLLHSILKLAD